MQTLANRTLRSRALADAIRASLLLAGAVAFLPDALAAEAEPSPVAEIVATFSERPGNPAITPDGRTLLSVHPLDHPHTKMVEIAANGALRAYPSAEFAAGEASRLKALIAIRIADDGTTWILDLGAKKLHGWNTRTERLARTIDIPPEVLAPTSFL